MEVTKAGSNAQASVSNVSKVEGGVESVSWLHVTSNANEALKKAYAVGDADMCLAIVIQGYSWGSPKFGLVESDGDVKGELVEAAGYKFLVSDQVTNYVPRMSDITVDFSIEGYQKGFLVYLND